MTLIFCSNLPVTSVLFLTERWCLGKNRKTQLTNWKVIEIQKTMWSALLLLIDRAMPQPGKVMALCTISRAKLKEKMVFALSTNQIQLSHHPHNHQLEELMGSLWNSATLCSKKEVKRRLSLSTPKLLNIRRPAQTEN